MNKGEREKKRMVIKKKEKGKEKDVNNDGWNGRGEKWRGGGSENKEKGELFGRCEDK